MSPSSGEDGAQGASARHGAAVLVAYVLLAVLATYPLALRARDHLYGEGTPPLNVWAMGWVLHQLPRDPVHLFDGNAFHPYPRTLAYSEHLFVPALLGAPAALLTGNLVLAHNVVALLSLATAGLGMYLLARELTGDGLAAFGAGLLYAFHTWNVNELIRLQILSNQWFPFVLLALLRFCARPSRRRAALVGAFYLLQSLSCMYWALYLPLLAAPALVILAWRHRLQWRALVAVGASLAAALAVTTAFALPYIQNSRELGFAREEPEAVDIDRYLDVLPSSVLYKHLLGAAQPNQNAAHFLGFLGMGLGLVGLVGGVFRREHSGLRALLALLVVAGFALSLGPEIRLGGALLARGPYAVLMNGVPGFHSVRYPERFSLFLILGLAPLVAAGLARLRAVAGAAAALVAVGLLFLEHLSIPLKLVPIPAGDGVPAVYRWLGQQPDVRVTAEVPAARNRMERLDALPMYLSTVHWKRTVQGFTGYFPPTYNFTRWRLFHFPDPESVAFLERFGVDTVVVRPEDGRPPSWAVADPRWTIQGPFPEGHVALRLSAGRELRYAPPPDDDALFAEIERRGWQVQASRPGAAAAIDGDIATAWSTGDQQGQGDFYRIRFARPARVARIALFLRSPFCFPTRLKVMGEVEGPDWVEIPFDAAVAFDRLFASLLHRPRDARFVIDLEPRVVSALRLRITETDPYFMPWTMSEIRAYDRRPASPAS